MESLQNFDSLFLTRLREELWFFSDSLRLPVCFNSQYWSFFVDFYLVAINHLSLYLKLLYKRVILAKYFET